MQLEPVTAAFIATLNGPQLWRLSAELRGARIDLDP
jgi:hypothetical protein